MCCKSTNKFCFKTELSLAILRFFEVKSLFFKFLFEN